MTRITQIGDAIQRREPKLTTVIPVRNKRHGGRKVVIPARGTPEAQTPEHHEPILNALARAYHWQRLLDEGRMSSEVEIARQDGLNQSSVNELLRLTLLTPDIIELLLAGRQPRRMTLMWFQRHPLPVDWQAQRQIVARFEEKS